MHHRRLPVPARWRARAAGLALPVALLLASVLSTRAHAAPPAGSPVLNTAQAEALAGTTSVRAASNTVRVTVQALERVTLAPDRGVTAAAGEAVVLAHRLRNLGNTDSDIALDAVNLTGDGFDLTAVVLVHDLDRDGAVSALDIALAPGAALTLAPGDSADLVLSARVPAAAPAAARALVRIAARSRAQGASASITDTVLVRADAAGPALAFFDPDYTAPRRSTPLGSLLHVQALAPACDLDPARPDTLGLELVSTRTGDRERFRAVETGLATGTFRITPSAPAVSALSTSAKTGDGQVSTVRGDRVWAVLNGCGAGETRAGIWIEPGGLAFDARSDTPVAGVLVRLVDESGAGNGGDAGGAARVLAEDGVTPAPAEMVTGPDGRFVFPRVEPSLYRLVVTPPQGHRFPSQVPLLALPPGHALEPSGSYGLPFAISEPGSPIAVDLPLDGEPLAELQVAKQALRAEVEPGDVLEYEVRITHRGDSALAGVSVEDQLPPGFTYAPGSAARDGTRLADPAGGGGPPLVFALGPMAVGSSTTLRYRVVVGPGAPRAEAVNTAWAVHGAQRSGPARARVRVRGDAFSDDALVLGQVWFADGLDAAGAARLAGRPDSVRRGPGVPGVRVVLDDGTWAITDAHGRFRFVGLAARTHALRLDPTSLPPGARPLALTHRERHTPGLLAVDLTRGGLARAEFAIWGDTAVARESQERRLAAAPTRDELGRALAHAQDPAATEARERADSRTLPASRVVTGESSLPARRDRATTAVLPAASAAPMEVTLLESVLPTLDPDLGFLGLADLDTVSGEPMAVRVKGRLGTPLRLRVNGQSVPESRVGRRLTAAQAGIEAWEYLGIPLRPGVNVLEVAPPRSVGRVAVRVVAPGPLARLVLQPPVRAVADGMHQAQVALRLVDAAGVPVGARHLVTLEASRGRIALADLDPSQPGTQVAVEGGALRVPVASPTEPGEALLRAASGAHEARVRFEFLPEMRPLLAVGSIEGVLSLHSLLRRGGAVSGMPDAGFESPIGQWSSRSRDGDAAAAARAALFLKGEVRPGVQLTLGYDSDRPADQKVMRDLDTRRGYLVTGDAAIVGYDAQSTGRLYARLERRDASFTYGDLVTGGDSPRALGRYARTLTGAEGRFGEGRTRLSGFSSRQNSRRVVDELPGRGVSGPYLLRRAPMVENSERVEVLVRDRAQPAVIRGLRVQQRFVDYDLDPLSGRLVFRSPVPSVDAGLDPVFVRVTYEIESGGEPAWVHGLDLRVPVTRAWTLGGVYVDDHDPVRRYALRGMSLEGEWGPRSRASLEWAGSSGSDALGAEPAGPRGDAGRFEFVHEADSWSARAWGVRSTTGFVNSGASVGAGRREAGARWTRRTRAGTRFTMEALHSADDAGRERRTGLLAGVDRGLSEWLRGEFGVRLAEGRRDGAAAEPRLTTLRTRLGMQHPRFSQGSAYAELEQDLREADRRLIALGGELRPGARTRVHARHELASSLGGAWALTSGTRQLASVLGIEAELSRDARWFSEYRLSDAMAARDAQAAVGLRQGWRLRSGLRVGTHVERVHPIAGPATAQGPATALTGSLEWSDDPDWKGSARMEVRTSRGSDQFLQGMAAAVRLDSSWTALLRHQVTYSDARSAGRELEERAGATVAYRPLDRPWDVLARQELHYRISGRGAARAREVTHVLATHAGWRLDPRSQCALAWAGKLTRHEARRAVSAGGAQWLRGRYTRDLARDFDAAFSISLLSGRSLAQRTYGVGAEVGRQIPGGVWLSLGYNLHGYEDSALVGGEWTRQGAFLRLRARFDETLLQRPRGWTP